MFKYGLGHAIVIFVAFDLLGFCYGLVALFILAFGADYLLLLLNFLQSKTQSGFLPKDRYKRVTYADL